MNATTIQKARLLDLATCVLELTRDGRRDIESVSAVLQIVKDNPDFVAELLTNSSSIYQVVIDYDKSSYQMIEAGKYDASEQNLPEFSHYESGKKNVEITLLHFNRSFNSSEDVIKEIEAKGLQPARMEELFALATCYPEVQKAFSIVALKHHTKRPHSCFVINADQDGRRFLRLYSKQRTWGKDYRFAAVKPD